MVRGCELRRACDLSASWPGLALPSTPLPAPCGLSRLQAQPLTPASDRAPRDARACFAGCESVGDFHRRGFLIQSAGWGWRPARMPRSYSLDLRERAVALVDDGRSRREVARLFKIGVSSVIRWCQRARATG